MRQAEVERRQTLEGDFADIERATQLAHRLAGGAGAEWRNMQRDIAGFFGIRIAGDGKHVTRLRRRVDRHHDFAFGQQFTDFRRRGRRRANEPRILGKLATDLFQDVLALLLQRIDARPQIGEFRGGRFGAILAPLFAKGAVERSQFGALVLLLAHQLRQLGIADAATHGTGSNGLLDAAGTQHIGDLKGGRQGVGIGRLARQGGQVGFEDQAFAQTRMGGFFTILRAIAAAGNAGLDIAAEQRQRLGIAPAPTEDQRPDAIGNNRVGMVRAIALHQAGDGRIDHVLGSLEVVGHRPHQRSVNASAQDFAGSLAAGFPLQFAEAFKRLLPAIEAHQRLHPATSGEDEAGRLLAALLRAVARNNTVERLECLLTTPGGQHRVAVAFAGVQRVLALAVARLPGRREPLQRHQLGCPQPAALDMQADQLGSQERPVGFDRRQIPCFGC